LCGPCRFLQPQLVQSWPLPWQAASYMDLTGSTAARFSHPQAMVTAGPEPPSLTVAFNAALGVYPATRRVPRPLSRAPGPLGPARGHREESFRVAWRLIHPRHRGAILAFYEFVRVADDIADHATLAPQQKLELLDRLEAGLIGQHDDSPQATALRTVLRERKL